MLFTNNKSQPIIKSPNSTNWKNSQMTTQNICKIVIVGDGAVGKINSKLTQGKTCLLSVYVNNEFPESNFLKKLILRIRTNCF